MGSSPSSPVFLYVVLAAGTFYALVVRRDKLRSGFLLFICTLGLGYRSIPVTHYLRIIPAEILVFVLGLMVVLVRRPGGRPAAAGRPPGWMLALLPFWCWAWVPAVSGPISFDLCLVEFLNFLLLLPLYSVTAHVLERPGGWRVTVLYLFAMSSVLAAVGVFEYRFPEVARSIPGFAQQAFVIAGEEDRAFRRAGFTFYGCAIAVFICVVVIPFGMTTWRWWPSPRGRALTAVGVAVQLAAVYISGYRSMWLLIALQFAALTLFRRQLWLVVALASCGLFGYTLLPTATRARVDSLLHVLEGRPEEVDTSGQKRWLRATEALDAALANPTGNGWAASGWVHSDFIQIAANQGVVPGLIFLGAYLAVLVRLGRAALRRPRGGSGLSALGIPLFLSFIAVGGILLFEGVEFLPQTLLPVWVMWVLAEVWLRQLGSRPDARLVAETSARYVAGRGVVPRFGRNGR
jgi:hypothetical protein